MLTEALWNWTRGQYGIHSGLALLTIPLGRSSQTTLDEKPVAVCGEYYDVPPI